MKTKHPGRSHHTVFNNSITFLYCCLLNLQRQILALRRCHVSYPTEANHPRVSWGTSCPRIEEQYRQHRYTWNYFRHYYNSWCICVYEAKEDKEDIVGRASNSIVFETNIESSDN